MFLIVVLTLALILTSILVLTSKNEFYQATYAYQNNVVPYLLSRKSTQGWMKAAGKVCNDRVSKACARVKNYSQKISCVQDQLRDCHKFNSKAIQQRCLEKTNNILECLHPDLVD